jgi:site-specific DNA-cytosine methylase
VSVREYLRAQGFPDSFDFDLEDEETTPKYVIRGIGNSVPVPLAAALGDGLPNP